MFQYAAGLAMALRHGAELRFDLDWFDAFQLHQGLELPRVFGLELPLATAINKRRVLGLLSEPRLRHLVSRRSLRFLRPSRFAIEPHFHFWPQFTHLPDDVYLDGYWQSERYFSSSAQQIREAFRITSPLDASNAALAQQIDATTSVSVHVRRGDFARNPEVSRVHGVDLREYYWKAIEAIGRRLNKPHYFIFSDEPEWVRGHLDIAAPWTVVDHNSGVNSYRDMQLMSLCRHHVIANSTFSWWGAWLNPRPDKIVVAPCQWFANDTPTDDLIPATWIRL
ncbi:alpha-1,2-fucosyltransferase [Dechloromonas sp. A34]|uniref:alpha-1,2-fucosyltransferase n=1 Tax=Dechloromonas sp. A34 TaxID=447588 RepID=UPI0022494EBE|nr:alpha-1,2-fucosyltransferase [Dechloromonas sp. A34]